MIHKLSTATTYLQTFIIHPQTGKHILRSYATGFFIRTQKALMLVTNWHVVTGLDPANPSVANVPPPCYLKATVYSKSRMVTELSLPLYSASMEPRWKEHSSGRNVDVIFYQLPLALDTYFDFVDIHSAEDDATITENVAKDVFILGYPFSRDEMREAFGEEAPYYLPIWKRGSIATEPTLRLGKHVLLIDSLSRAGMSGAPVVIAQDDKLMNVGSQENYEAFNKILTGETGALEALAQLDTKTMTEVTVKRFRLLGVYSGTIGSTRLPEIALGKCWHVEVLRALISTPRHGIMPFHAPVKNDHYDTFLAERPDGSITFRNADGEVVEQVQMRE